MHGFENDSMIFIILTVVLFMFLGIAILVVIDHKAKIPGHFHDDAFSIIGLRRDHPVISFLTTIILFAVISSLIFELTVALSAHFGLFQKKEAPKLVQALQQQRVSESKRHFHNEPVQDLVNLGKKPVCFSCHGDYPHSKEPMIRTLLNMHTQFAGCMTCHNDPRKVDEKSLKFAWLNYSGITVKGKPYGTDVDPNTGYLIDTDDYYSKIVAYSGDVTEANLLEIPETNPEVQEFLAIRDKLSDVDKEAIKKQFHKKVSPKGRFCSRCHTDENESYLPFRQLGFSDSRVSAVTNLNIIGIVQKYRKFYLPNLFQKDGNLPKVESLLGEEKTDKVKEVVEDPNSWWRRNFDSPSEKQ